MAATAAAMASASVVAAPVAANKLSSSAAFGASSTQAQFAPLRSVHFQGCRVVAATANYSEEETSPVRQVVSSVLAAGLAITIAGSAFAASGPGGDGAQRTARKADELLKGADSLIKNDSPQRFGPERGFGNGTSGDDAERFSRKAGSGAIPGLQEETSAQVSGARDKFASNLEKSKRRIDGIWGMGKGMANDVVATTQGKADEVTKGAKKSFFGGLPKINQASTIKDNVGSAASDVKSKADEAAASAQSTGGGFFGKIKQQTRALQGKK